MTLLDTSTYVVYGLGVAFVIFIIWKFIQFRSISGPKSNPGGGSTGGGSTGGGNTDRPGPGDKF